MTTSVRLLRKFVVAIDFGTTFSGFAFAAVPESPDVPARSVPIFEVYEWEGAARAPYMYCKTPTVILYTDQGVPVEFGWNAQLAAQQQQSSSTKSANMLVKRFKLHLADDIPDDIDPLPAGVEAVTAISQYLRYMKDKALSTISSRLDLPLPGLLRTIQWCITVPAIWSDAAKGAMQTAAELAGLVASPYSPDGSPHSLITVLEPEAASLYVMFNSNFDSLLYVCMYIWKSNDSNS